MLEKIIEAAKNKKVKLSTHAMAQAADRKISTQDIIDPSVSGVSNFFANSLETEEKSSQDADTSNARVNIHAILNCKKYVFFAEKNKFNIYGDYSENILLMVSGVYLDGILVITTHKISKKRVKLWLKKI